MILVDTSVWIDYFRGNATPQADLLDQLLASEPVLIGDLILAELLQGIRSDRDFDAARRFLGRLDVIDIGGVALAVQAARHFRTLRSMGITVRKTVDTLIATRCIAGGIALLHDDRDFDPFAAHLGLLIPPLR